MSADLGYCAFDARRRPLTGLELRGCWEERIGAVEPEPTPAVEAHRLRAAKTPWSATPPGSTDAVMARDFVPLELLGRRPVDGETPPAAAAEAKPDVARPFLRPDPEDDWSERTSLFGDGER